MVRIIETTEELATHENEFAGVLSRAFYHDPYYVFIMPNDEKRIGQLHWWMKILLRYTLKYGTINYTDDHEGIALWIGPNKPIIDDVKMLFLGLMLYPFKVGFRNFARLSNISGRWNKEHKKQNKRHYYLMVIGVEPESQRKGTGSRLLRAGLEKADIEKLDCYLETVTSEGTRFYTNHNFEVIRNESFGKKDQYWLMKRAPLSCPRL